MRKLKTSCRVGWWSSFDRLLLLSVFSYLNEQVEENDREQRLRSQQATKGAKRAGETQA